MRVCANERVCTRDMKQLHREFFFLDCSISVPLHGRVRRARARVRGEESRARVASRWTQRAPTGSHCCRRFGPLPPSDLYSGARRNVGGQEGPGAMSATRVRNGNAVVAKTVADTSSYTTAGDAAQELRREGHTRDYCFFELPCSVSRPGSGRAMSFAP